MCWRGLVRNLFADWNFILLSLWRNRNFEELRWSVDLVNFENELNLEYYWNYFEYIYDWKYMFGEIGTLEDWLDGIFLKWGVLLLFKVFPIDLEEWFRFKLLFILYCKEDSFKLILSIEASLLVLIEINCDWVLWRIKDDWFDSDFSVDLDFHNYYFSIWYYFLVQQS